MTVKIKKLNTKSIKQAIDTLNSLDVPKENRYINIGGLEFRTDYKGKLIDDSNLKEKVK